MAGFSPQRVFSFKSLVFSSRRKGFTLIELLISTALFTLTVTGLIVIFTVITGIQVKESGVVEVNQQAQTLQTQIQYYIQNARLADMTADTTASTLKLRESDQSKDPTYIYLGGGSIQFVQSAVSSCSGLDPLTVTLSSSTTAGDLLALVADRETTSTVTVTDSIGNSYALAVTAQNSGLILNKSSTIQIWYAVNMATSASDTLTVSGGGDRMALLAYEYSGNAASNVLYTTSANGTSTSGNVSSSRLTVQNAGDLVVGAAMEGGAPGNITGETNWNLRYGTQICNLWSDVEDTTSTTGGGSYGADFWSDSSPGMWSAVDAAFRAGGNTVYLQQTDSGTPTPLTSNKVSVSNLNFTRHYQIASSTAIGNESVSYSFTMSASSPNGQQFFSQTLQSAAQVLAPVPKIALIQKAMGENNNTNISGVSSTFSGANTAGNLLLAVVSNQGSAPSPPTLADTQGNAWTNIASPRSGGGALGPWQMTTPLPYQSAADSAFMSNGFIYLSESSFGTYYAKPNSDGSVSSWSSTTALNATFSTSFFTTPVNNGYVYMVGGDASPTGVTSTVAYAPINADGSLGTLKTTTRLPSALEQQGSAAYNGYIYTIGGATNGGSSNFATSSVFYAKPNSDGSISNWSSTTALPIALTFFGGATYNGYFYAWGGESTIGGVRSGVYYAKFNADGTVGSWLTGTTLPDDVSQHAGTAYNGYLYSMGGNDGTPNPTSTVLYAPINADGSIGSWVASKLPFANLWLSSIAYNGYLYTLGGLPDGATATATVLYSSIGSNPINVFAAANAKAGANTVTATFGAGTASYPSIFLYEYRGANTTLSVDASSSQSQTSTAPSSGFVNPQGNVELLLGVSDYDSLIDTWTPGSGYTMESSSTVSATLAEDKVIYGTSPVDASWTINNARTTLDLVVGLH
jgi:prepilin-type N-terminal cleavage/methylation domain-containing protein